MSSKKGKRQKSIQERTCNLKRKTQETEINIKLNLDGSGDFQIETPFPFLSHMLELLSKHSLIDMKLSASGASVHHVTEDLALTLGDAIGKALQERKGIRRYGFAAIPMDDSLAKAIIDLGGRPYLKYFAYFSTPMIEDWPVELIAHFFESLSQTLKANIHFELTYGSNEHHKVEALFKSFAHALRQAIEMDPRETGIPSSKGVI